MTVLDPSSQIGFEEIGVDASRTPGEEGMFRFSVRATALAGVVLATVTLPAQAAHHGGGPCCGEGLAADCCASPCAPALRTITVTEWVPETYEAIRTCYRTEYVCEKYTAYRTECVPETRTRTVTVNRLVPVTVNEVRTVYTCVPTVETRTCYRTVVKCVPVTVVTRKCVDMGHYECREVPVREGCFTRMRKHFHHRDDCCEPCPPPPCTKTVKVWVPCKVWVETPVTTMKRVCETVPETVQVTVNKMVPVQKTFPVTTYKCVSEPKVETCTVLVPRQVAYEATRTVAKCVPVQEKVQMCRLVPRTVQKQVAEECCVTFTACCGGHRLFGRGHGHGHRSSCCD
jgi:hypothetical protein